MKLYGEFAKENGIDFDEARRFLSSREFREWRMYMQDYLQKISGGDKGLSRELSEFEARLRITRLEKLYAETLQELDKLGRNVDESLRNFLSDAYTENYQRNIFDFVKNGGLSVAIAKVDSHDVSRVLASRWSGKDFSKRVWNNTTLLSRNLRSVIANGVHRGLTIQQMSQMIEDKMHAGYNNAVRLVRTEMNFVNNQAHYDSMKDAEVEYYEFIAVLDNRTSQRCRALDGEVFPLEERDVGANYPPMHARCRSTVAPFIEGVSRRGTRVAKDRSGRNIEIPAAMTYQDYESVYIKKEKTLEAWKVESGLLPKFETVKYEDAAKIRPAKEFTDIGQELKLLAEKYVGRPSQWSGKIIFGKDIAKDWTCDILLVNDTLKHVFLHEMLHSCSVSYYSQEVYKANRYKEELAVQLLNQEISLAEGIPIISSGYDEGVKLIRDFKRALKMNISNLEFAQNLVRQPLPERWDYLEELLANAFSAEFTVEDYDRLLKNLEAIKLWKPPKEK